MSLLLNVIFASHARSTHHKLALDALKHLQGVESARWTDVLINHYSAYLEGAKAPDDDFKDFKNHVLHVKDNFWGGAVSSVQHWYGQFVDHLRGEEWKDAAYAAGVLSHYYSDPQMPFHTGQTESEGAVHRAAEWSVTKSYEKLRTLIEQDLGGYPNVPVNASENWLEEMVKSGAVMANEFYDLLIDHYDLSVGVKDPPAGLDRVAQEAVAKCLAHATVGFARILDRAFEEAAMTPPEVTLTVKAVLATVNMPIRKIVNGLADARDRKEVEAIFEEVQETGKAIHSLPESEKLVRQFHAAEVRKVSMLVLNSEKARPAGQKFGKPKDDVPTLMAPVSSKAASRPDTIPAKSKDVTPLPSVARPVTVDPSSSIVPPVVAAAAAAATPSVLMPPAVTPSLAIPSPATPPDLSPAVASGNRVNAAPRRVSGQRFFLTPEAAIVDAPSIGPKTATRFNQIGIISIAEFLAADPDETATRIATRHISADVIREWQAQSRLMIHVPGLRGHDAQLLVAANVLDQDALSVADARELLRDVTAVASTSQGRSILRNSTPPDLEEVNSWIDAAQQDQASLELKAG